MTTGGQRDRPGTATAIGWIDLSIVLVLAIYVILPTKNYYWDGVSFAQNIEQAGTPGSPAFWPNLIHPNHLAYDSLGYLAWTALRSLGLQIRAIGALQAVNMASAAACVGILRRTLLRLTKSEYLGTTLALLLAFSAIFWRFATDADAYIASVLFLIAAFHILCTSPKPRHVLVAVLHVCAMLIHQLALFFFPAAAFGVYLKGGRRSLLQYCVPTAAITLAAYYWGFWLQTRLLDPHAFLHWVASHSSDVTFTFNVPKDLAITLMNYPRLFFGGTARLLQFFGPFMLVAFVLLAGTLTALLVLLARHREGLRLLWHMPEVSFPLRIALAWLVPYAVFLFFWIPSNTFYKLFCLPAIVVIMAEVLTQYRGPRHYRLALFVATMMLANLSLYIYPQSRPEYHQALRFAHRMSRVWSGGTVVYYDDFIVDDWFIRYFNPTTTWKRMDSERGAADFQSSAQLDLAAGHEVWIDTTAAQVLFRSWPGVGEHFDAVQEDSFPKHPIRFYRWSGAGPPLQK